ncbi:unnamed protein product, partial [Urochloa humidicola]
QGRHPLLHLLLLRPIPTRARRTTTTSSCAPDSPDLRPQLPPPPPRRRGGSCRPVPLGGVAPPLHPLPLPSATSADGPAERPASVSAMAPLVAARDAEQSRPGGGQNSGEAGADLGGGRPDLRRWLDFCGERGSCGRGRGLLFPTGPLLFGSIRAAKNLGATPPRQSKY